MATLWHESTERSPHVAKARARVTAAASAVIAGVLLGRAAEGVPAWTFCTLIALALCVAAILLRRKTTVVPWTLVWLACAAGAAALTTHRLWTTPTTSLTARVGDLPSGDGPLLTLEAIVRTAPTPTQGPDPTSLTRFAHIHDQPRWWCEVDVRALVMPGAAHDLAATSRLALVVEGELPQATPTTLARPGVAIRVTGRYEPPRAPSNPGEPDAQLAARASGRVGALHLSSAELILPAQSIVPTRVDQARAACAELLASLRARSQQVLSRAAATSTPAGASLLHALILGTPASDDPASQVQARATQQQFTRLGLAHALSISGFHLSVMALVALWAIRLTGDHGWLEPALVALLVLLYLALVPPSPPLTRSAILVLTLLASQAMGRRWDPVCVLLWVAIAMLLADPLVLWNLGFQLSLGLTALLLWSVPHAASAMFATPIRGLLDPRPRPVRALLEGTQRALATAVVCWLCALPVVMHHAGMLSPWGILASVLVAPLIVLVLWVGYAALLLGVLIPPLASAAAWLLGGLTRLVLGVTGELEALPFSALRVPPTPALWTLVASLVFVLASRMATKRTAWRWTLASSLLVAWLAIAWTRAASLPAGTLLRVDMLSVGDGSCFLIRDATGKALLWDAKPPTRSPRGVLPPLVASARALGVARVEQVVLTHPDLDHVAGLLEVLEPLGVREVLVPQRFVDQAEAQPQGLAAAALAGVRSRGLTLRMLASGDTLRLGDATATILSPPSAADFTQDNDHALVALWEARASNARLGTHSARLLMTGDVGAPAIARLAHQALPAIDAMELPHHGAPVPAAIAWTLQLAPRVALQSTAHRRAAQPGWEALTTTDRRISAHAGWTRVDILATGEVVVRSMRE